MILDIPNEEAREMLAELVTEERNAIRYFLLGDTDDIDETNIYAEIINENSDNGEYAPTYVAATSLAALAEDIQDSFQTLFLFTTVIGLITTIAGGMAIIVTQMMSVSSRKKEFAILKSTGWKNIHIFKNVIYDKINY